METELNKILAEAGECIAREDFDQGAKLYLDILNKYSDLAVARQAAYAGLGLISLKQSRLDLAEDYLKKALSYSHLEPGYHYMLGTVYLLSKRADEAVKELEICVKQDPDNLGFQKMLGLAEDTASLLRYGAAGDDAGESSGILERRASRLLASQAASFLKEGKLKKAREFAQNALWSNPHNERAKRLLIDIQKKQLEKASVQTAGRKSSSVIYQFRARLRGISPPIWRRFQVPGTMSLYKLHLVLQELMDWDNYHLFEFIIGEAYFSVPDPEDFHQSLDAHRYKIEKVIAENNKLLYRYDFGDNWEVELKAEKIIPASEPLKHPVCLSGKRAGPPEDSGGIPGYEQYVQILRTPSPEDPEDEDPEILNMREWIGDYDPEFFDIEEVNERLKRIS